MGLFNALGVAGTGVTAYRKWMDAVSDNLANMNDAATPGSADLFRARYVVARAIGDETGTGANVGGVQVAGIEYGPARGKVVYDPDNPLANDQGYVEYPQVELSDQMTQLMMAQRGYQANLAVAERARTAYEAALQLGRGA